MSARHALIYSGRRLSGTRGLRTASGVPELTLAGNEILRVEMNLTGYLQEGEKVLDCVLHTHGVEAARVVTPSKVTLKVRGHCHGEVHINVLTSSRERIRETIRCLPHEGAFADWAVSNHSRVYGNDWRYHGNHSGPMVARPGPRIVRTPLWRHICNLGNPMQNHTTSTKVPDYAVSGDLLFDPERKALYLWFNTGQYDEWVPISRRKADWTETDKFSDAYIDHKPLIGSTVPYVGTTPPDKSTVPPGSFFRHSGDDTTYQLIEVAPGQLEWEDITA